MKKNLILFVIMFAFTTILTTSVKAQTPTQEYYHEITNDLGTFKIWVYMTEDNGVDHVDIMDPEFNTWPVDISWKVYAGGYGSSSAQVTEFSGSFGGFNINWAGYFDPIHNYQPIITD